MVPETGLEPAHLAIRDPKSRASANFATPAKNWDVWEELGCLRLDVIDWDMGWWDNFALIPPSHIPIYPKLSPTSQFWPNSSSWPAKTRSGSGLLQLLSHAHARFLFQPGAYFPSLKRRTMRTLVTSSLLILCLSLSAIATPHPKPNGKAVGHDDEGDLHAVRKAIAALNSIKPEFDNTAVNLCGHRTDAADAVAKAVTQLMAASACGKQESEGYKLSGKTTQARAKAVLRQLNKTLKELSETDDNYCGNRQNAYDATANAIRVLTLVRDCKE
jgi:hypothetical protein